MKIKKKIKLLKQNEKRKLFNRRYKGKIKFFLKLLKIEVFRNPKVTFSEKIVKFSEIFSLLTSILDKATKKKPFIGTKTLKKSLLCKKCLRILGKIFSEAMIFLKEFLFPLFCVKIKRVIFS